MRPWQLDLFSLPPPPSAPFPSLPFYVVFPATHVTTALVTVSPTYPPRRAWYLHLNYNPGFAGILYLGSLIYFTKQGLSNPPFQLFFSDQCARAPLSGEFALGVY